MVLESLHEKVLFLALRKAEVFPEAGWGGVAGNRGHQLNQTVDFHASLAGSQQSLPSARLNHRFRRPELPVASSEDLPSSMGSNLAQDYSRPRIKHE